MNSYKETIQEALTAQEAWNEEKRQFQHNRADKRRSGTSAKGRAKRRVKVVSDVHAILAMGPHAWAPRRTGTPDWVRNLRAQGERRRLLSKLNTRKLRPVIGDAADVLHKAGFKNIWQLSQADLNDLLKVDDLETGALRSLRRYLSSKNIPVRWLPV